MNMAPYLDKAKLHEFSIDVAQFSTGHFSVKLPTTEFALNGRGAPDCAIFDFTNLYSARNACRVKVKKGRDLLMTVVGDSLLEPFWPTGSGKIFVKITIIFQIRLGTLDLFHANPFKLQH